MLNTVGLPIREGEFVTLVGPSGCGKSTLLRLILGVQEPNEGVVYLDGKAVDGLGPDRGVVFQRYSLFPNLTVAENIAMGPILAETTLLEGWFKTKHYKSVRKRALADARDLILRVGLTLDEADKYPVQLSGGQRQRVAIAQALLMKPKILLMDEPFGALDVNTRLDMQLLILEQWEQENMTIIFITHDLDEAVYLGTRIIGLSQYHAGDEGAKIVTDFKPDGEHPKPSSWRESAEFHEIVSRVQRDVLDPNYRQHESEFNHNHEDAWRPSNGGEKHG